MKVDMRYVKSVMVKFQNGLLYAPYVFARRMAIMKNDNAMKMCDGDCGKVYYLENLYSTCYTQDFCKDCMCTFLAEQEDGRVYDAITGEE